MATTSSTHKQARAKQVTCYHCSEQVPQDSEYFALAGGKRRQLCSQSCQDTVAWIEKIGLSDYYRLRRKPSARTSQAQLSQQDWSSPSLLGHVVKEITPQKHEINLLIDGMHCSACSWLIERALLQLGGVSDVQINPVTHRAIFTIDPAKTSLQDALLCLQSSGYQPRPLHSDSLDSSRKDENRALLKRLVVAGFGMMQVMTFAFVLYMENFGELPAGTKELFRWLGFLIATPVVFYSASPFYQSAFHSLKMRGLNMDVPIAIALTAVYGSSVLQAVMNQGEVYFESVTMLVFFLLIGRYVEMRARHHSIDNADALVHLTPSFAQKVLENGEVETLAVDLLTAGDTVRIMEGAHIPADGILLSAKTRLDEALLSGEATARVRLQGEPVVAGSLVLDGPIEIQVEKVGSETFLSSLVNLTTKAQAQRPKLSRRSEKATTHFVIRALVLTAITLTGWLYYDPSQALEATIALLVVACPCALGLAAPAAITRALGVLAKKNILIVNPDALENLEHIETAVFDKTGTLTEPVINAQFADKDALQLAASLARESQHPLSRALLAANEQAVFAVKHCQSFTGLGMEGEVKGRKLRLGQAKFALKPELQALAEDASLVLGENGELIATFDVDESLREDAKFTVKALQQQGVTCEIMSGDSDSRVTTIAEQLGVNKHWSRQLPEDKLAYIKELHQQEKRVLMVGDGSNDAPVLAGADVSIALTSGAELAQANADVLFCDGKLAHILYLQKIAAQTRVILQQNQRWAMMYNTLAMPTAALGYIPPWLAAIFMSLSSLFVVVNALRIGRGVD